MWATFSEVDTREQAKRDRERERERKKKEEERERIRDKAIRRVHRYGPLLAVPKIKFSPLHSGTYSHSIFVYYMN